jgi:hypothetical protein
MSTLSYDKIFAWLEISSQHEIHARVNETVDENERFVYSLLIGLSVNNPDIVRQYCRLVNTYELIQSTGNITSVLQFAMKYRAIFKDVNIKNQDYLYYSHYQMEETLNVITNVLLDEGVAITGEDYLIACYHGIKEIVSDYLYRNEDINYKSKKRIDEYGIRINDDAIVIAAENNHVEIVQLLLSKNIDILCDFNIGTPLFSACCGRFIEIVKLLLSDRRHESYINYRDEEGFTPIILAASVTDNIHVCELLVRKYSCDINAANNEGLTALICIMSSLKPNKQTDRIRLLQTMIERNVHISGIEFLLACFHGYECIVDAYISRGGDPHFMLQTVPSYSACGCPGHIPIVANKSALWNACFGQQNIYIIDRLLMTGSYGMKHIETLDMLEDPMHDWNRESLLNGTRLFSHRLPMNSQKNEWSWLKSKFITCIWDRRKYFLLFLIRNNYLDPAVTQRVLGKLSRKTRRKLLKIPTISAPQSAMTRVYQMPHLVFVREIMSYL